MPSTINLPVYHYRKAIRAAEHEAAYWVARGPEILGRVVKLENGKWKALPFTGQKPELKEEILAMPLHRTRKDVTVALARQVDLFKQGVFKKGT